MPGGARRSLASPVVSGVLCQCGGATTTAVAAAPSPSSARSAPVAADGPPGGGGSCSAAEHERRVQSLFVQLDVNRDGALCVHDLAVGLQRLGLHRSERDLWSLANSSLTCLLVYQLSRFRHVSPSV